MEKTRSEECITVLIGASTGSGFSHYNWNTGRMCLGGVEPPATPGDAEQGSALRFFLVMVSLQCASTFGAPGTGNADKKGK